MSRVIFQFHVALRLIRGPEHGETMVDLRCVLSCMRRHWRKYFRQAVEVQTLIVGNGTHLRNRKHLRPVQGPWSLTNQFYSQLVTAEGSKCDDSKVTDIMPTY